VQVMKPKETWRGDRDGVRDKERGGDRDRDRDRDRDGDGEKERKCKGEGG